MTQSIPLTLVSVLIVVVVVIVLYAFFYAVVSVKDLSDDDHDEPLP